MGNERKEFGKWWMWILGLLVVSIIVLSITGYAGKVTNTIVERKVFEESYQKKAGDLSRLNTYRAQLAQVNSLLMTENDPDIISNLKSQRAMLLVQISSIR